MMWGRNETNTGSEGGRIDKLRKINPSDRFPCFLCYDHPRDRTNCQECAGNGWLPGSHPMVQFAEDFIEKRLGKFTPTDSVQPVSEAKTADFGEVKPRLTGSFDPYKSGKLWEEGRESERLSGTNLGQSVNNDEQNYFCDNCNTEKAIVGARYHCLTCEDYDLCEGCFRLEVHRQHKMRRVSPPKKPTREELRNLGTCLKQTVRNFN